MQDPRVSVHLVQLDRDHPGFRDLVYRARRDAIARIAHDHQPGTAVADAPYSDEEHAVWRAIWRELGPVHQAHAAPEVLELHRRFALPQDRIIQLAEVNALLQPLTGFRLHPIAGLGEAEAWLRCLADGVFLSTQYIRHASMPLYTPEPDVVHEVVGHAPFLADPQWAELHRMFGRAAVRLAGTPRVQGLINVFWYTMEFGVVQQGDDVKAYGAGLMSSFGELGGFRQQASLRPFDLGVMEATAFDPTQYQSTLFVAPGLPHLFDALRAWLQR